MAEELGLTYIAKEIKIELLKKEKQEGKGEEKSSLEDEVSKEKEVITTKEE